MHTFFIHVSNAILMNKLEIDEHVLSYLLISFSHIVI